MMEAQVVENKPCARSGHCSAISPTTGLVYFVGGYLKKTTREYSFPQVWAYSPISRSCCRLETTGPVPLTCCSQSCSVVDNELFVFGGTGVPFGRENGNRMYKLNLSTNEWKVQSCTSCASDSCRPDPGFGQNIFKDNDSTSPTKLWIFGGTREGEFKNDLYKYDIRTSHFERIQPSTCERPWPRYKAEGLLWNNKIVVISGGDAMAPMGYIDYVDCFDIDLNVWSRINCRSASPDEGLPRHRRTHTVVMAEEGVALMHGGMAITAEIFNDLWTLDLRTFEWRMIRCNRRAPSLKFHTAVFNQESKEMITFGGVYLPVAEKRTNEIYHLRTNPSRLQDLSLKCLSKSKIFTTDALKEMGVPLHLVEKMDPFSNAPDIKPMQCSDTDSQSSYGGSSMSTSEENGDDDDDDDWYDLDEEEEEDDSDFYYMSHDDIP